MNTSIRECPCGSGEMSRDLHDARGLFLARVCGSCLEARLNSYRPDVLTDPSYEHDEPLDEEG